MLLLLLVVALLLPPPLLLLVVSLLLVFLLLPLPLPLLPLMLCRTCFCTPSHTTTASNLQGEPLTFWCSMGMPVASCSRRLTSSMGVEVSMLMLTEGPQGRPEDKQRQTTATDSSTQ